MSAKVLGVLGRSLCLLYGVAVVAFLVVFAVTGLPKPQHPVGAWVFVCGMLSALFAIFCALGDWTVEGA